MRGFDFDKALVALQNELHCFAYKLTADKDEAEDLLPGNNVEDVG